MSLLNDMRTRFGFNTPRDPWFKFPFSWGNKEVSHTTPTVMTISAVAVVPVDIGREHENHDAPPPYSGSSDMKEPNAANTSVPKSQPLIDSEENKLDANDSEESTDDEEGDATYTTSWTNYSSNSRHYHFTPDSPPGPEFQATMDNISRDVKEANTLAQRQMERAQRQMEESMIQDTTQNWGNGITFTTSSSTKPSDQGHHFIKKTVHYSTSGKRAKHPKPNARHGSPRTVNIVGSNNVVSNSISNVGNCNTSTVIVNGKVVSTSF